jgi:hypothetical protein
MNSGIILITIIGLLFFIGTISLVIDILYSKEEDLIPIQYNPPKLVVDELQYDFDDEDDQGTVIVE